MEQILTAPEIKTKRGELVSRIFDLALKGTEPKICPHFETCEHVVKHLSSQLGFSIMDRANYYNSVCSNYSEACELNLGNKN